MKLEEEMKKSSCIKTKMVHLDPYQEIALKNIDAMKEEMVNMMRKKRESGKDSFELIPEKANRLHDDRSYCMALCAWFLSDCDNLPSTKLIAESSKPSFVTLTFDVLITFPTFST